jgi:hypothetical protein
VPTTTALLPSREACSSRSSTLSALWLPWGDQIHWDDAAGALDSEVLNELWPDDEDLEGDEFKAVEQRVELFAARLLVQLAGASEWCARAAANIVEEHEKALVDDRRDGNGS